MEPAALLSRIAHRLLGQAGLREVIWDRFIPEGDGGHVLVLARKAGE